MGNGLTIWIKLQVRHSFSPPPPSKISKIIMCISIIIISIIISASPYQHRHISNILSATSCQHQNHHQYQHSNIISSYFKDQLHHNFILWIGIITDIFIFNSPSSVYLDQRQRYLRQHTGSASQPLYCYAVAGRIISEGALWRSLQKLKRCICPAKLWVNDFGWQNSRQNLWI